MLFAVQEQVQKQIEQAQKQIEATLQQTGQLRAQLPRQTPALEALQDQADGKKLVTLGKLTDGCHLQSQVL